MVSSSSGKVVKLRIRLLTYSTKTAKTLKIRVLRESAAPNVICLTRQYGSPVGRFNYTLFVVDFCCKFIYKCMKFHQGSWKLIWRGNDKCVITEFTKQTYKISEPKHVLLILFNFRVYPFNLVILWLFSPDVLRTCQQRRVGS